MPDTTCHMSISLDGFVAGPDQSLDNPLGKRDPFRSPLGESQTRPEGSQVCSEPLCQWDLDQLKLVAVVTGDANPLAMVEDPQTRGYIIHRGTRVGKQGGQVINELTN